MTTLSLKTLLVPSKSVDVEYPGLPGFVVSVTFLSRETMQTMRKKATKTTYKKHQPVEEIDDNLFLELYVKATISGWKGLKLKHLEQLAPVDLSGQDMEAELEYSEENALYLIKNSSAFDAFVNEQVTDLGKFSNTK